MYQVSFSLGSDTKTIVTNDLWDEKGVRLTRTSVMKKIRKDGKIHAIIKGKLARVFVWSIFTHNSKNKKIVHYDAFRSMFNQNDAHSITRIVNMML